MKIEQHFLFSLEANAESEDTNLKIAIKLT